MTGDTSSTEISLLDCLLFLRKEGKKIVLFSVLGLALGFVFYLTFPKTYQSTLLVRLGEYGPTAPNQLKGALIEEPNDFLEKMKLSSAYSPLVLEACALGENPEKIHNKIKVSHKKDSPVMEVLVKGKSREATKKCASAFFTHIKEEQEKISTPFLKEAKAKMEKRKATLAQVRNEILSTQEKPYFSESLHKEQAALREELNNLSNLIEGAAIREASLLTPITSPSVVFTQLSLSLFCGFILGLFGFTLVFCTSRVCTFCKRTDLKE